ncbi:MAG: efflux RND transporter periplasmic adaptor subunit [Silvanigrellales bacterium]|nr:efflux RND transporter periplasmic adaptor subunit [Silvanigrellales bacterium]
MDTEFRRADKKPKTPAGVKRAALRACSAFATLGFLAVVLGSVFSACTKGSEKVELPKESPAVQAPSEANVQPGTQVAAAGSIPGGTENPSAAEGTPATQREVISRVSGQVQSAKQGEQSFKVPGHIEQTLVKVGDSVKRGQLLAKLDDADYALRSRIATLQVDQAKIALEQTKRDMEREEQLKREGATTQANYERVSNQFSNSQLALAQAQLNQQQIKKQMDDTRLTAAYDGVVARRMKVEGEWVGVGAPVFQVAAVTELEVNLRVPESLLRKVTPGQKVPLSIPSLSKNTEMEVLRIVPVIQENSRTFEVIGRITRADGTIVPGQFVEAQF